MDKIIVQGGKKLSGDVEISSAKNAVLPIIAASLLSTEDIVIKNVPLLEDVKIICEVLKELNSRIEYNKITQDLYINNKNLNLEGTDNELIRKMRASFLIMGPLLARGGECKISLPGGCNIGSRPIDLHLKGLRALGAEIESCHGIVKTKAKRLIGNRIYLDFPSVGATENIMMAACLAQGETILENAAEEPEIVDLANFLKAMGADIVGAGYKCIRIRGVKRLKGVQYTPIKDRIEAGTYMVAAAITKGKIRIKDVNPEHLGAIIDKLSECGVNIESSGKDIVVDGSNKISSIDIKTLPYPGFPTDMQAQMMALLSIAEGTSIITETVFENRYMHVSELIRMGANIKIDGRSAIIDGVNKLTGCQVKATDLRAGAAMILAGLIAEGETEVTDIYHIDRGYINIEEKFASIGANIYRVSE